VPVALGSTPPVRRRTLRRVARPTEHRAVADVKRSTASGEREHVVDGQVARRMGVALIAGTPVPVLTTPSAEDACAEPLPGPRAVQRVVAAAIGRSRVDSAATTRTAGRDATHRAELDSSRGPTAAPQATLVTRECTPVNIVVSVIGEGDAVYSPAVLALRARG